jgi:hypothetical protein
MSFWRSNYEFGHALFGLDKLFWRSRHFTNFILSASSTCSNLKIPNVSIDLLLKEKIFLVKLSICYDCKIELVFLTAHLGTCVSCWTKTTIVRSWIGRFCSCCVLKYFYFGWYFLKRLTMLCIAFISFYLTCVLL